MNRTITVSPRDGVTVRHPESGMPIKPCTQISKTPQIIRYLKDGDLTEVKTPKKKAKATENK